MEINSPRAGSGRVNAGDLPASLFVGPSHSGSARTDNDNPKNDCGYRLGAMFVSGLIPPRSLGAENRV